MAIKYPGIKILIMRRSYPELMKNHIRILRLELKGIARYNDKDKVLNFSNTSTISFMYCANDRDLDAMQGSEYDIIFIDEATQFTEYQMKVISACNRGVNKFPKRMYYTCNPGGQGHGHIKRLFIDRKFYSTEKPEEYLFIQSLVTDNYALMKSQPEYVEDLNALPPKLRAAWLEGRWDVFEGQCFEEFRDDPEHYEDRVNTHVINPFIIPDTWKIYRGFDWGYNKPFSVGWYAIDHDRRMYRIRRYYGCQLDNRTKESVPNTGVKMTTGEIAKNIKQIEDNDINLKGRMIYGIADPAIFDESRGESIAAEMEKYKVYSEKADNTRIAGKMQCHFRLHFDEEGIPMFYVFNTDKDFIRTIPLLMYDDHKVEDIDTEGEDHIYDEWRYVCMENPLNPPAANPKKPNQYGEDPLELNKKVEYDKYNFIRL